MKKNLLWLILLVSFCQISFAQKNKKVLLNFNFKAGQKYQIDFGSNQQVSVQGMEMPQSFTMGTEYEVVSVEKDGTASIKITYNKIKFTQNNPVMGKIGYDSESKEEPDENSKMLATAFGQLKGKWVIVKMKKNGQLLEATEGDEALKKVIKEQGNNFGSYPEKPVKIGESWTSEEKRSMNGVVMNISTQFTLKALQDGKWIIDSIGKIKNEKGDEIGSQTGTTELSKNDLMQMKSVVNQDITSLEIQGMKMAVKSDNNITSAKK